MKRKILRFIKCVVLYWHDDPIRYANFYIETLQHDVNRMCEAVAILSFKSCFMTGRRHERTIELIKATNEGIRSLEGKLREARIAKWNLENELIFGVSNK